RVVERIPATRPVAPGLDTALVRLDGPILLSHGGTSEGRPWSGPALVAFGQASLPDRGDFSLELPSGLFLTGFRVGGPEVINLRIHQDGRPLDVPSWGLLFLSASLPSVAGGPADPGAWDRWFGDQNAFAEGEDEARARARKAESLSRDLAELYASVRTLRESGRPDPDRLHALAERVADFPEEWLLRAELAELMGEVAS
ncbi:MAG TPA: hypothetical protein VF768_05500, partial [Holophagaceae bacterium]